MIKKIEIENIKGISRIEITPNRNLQLITGVNEQGKSSLLDAIWLALSYSDSIKEIDNPLKNGEEEGVIKLELEDLIIERKFKRKENGDITTQLKVTNQDGAKFSSPQSVIDNLLNKISFNITKFIDMSDKDRLDTLLDVCGLKDEISKNEEKDKELREERLILGRVVSDKKGEVEGLKFDGIENVGTEEKNAQTIINQIMEGEQHNSKKDNLEANRNQLERENYEIGNVCDKSLQSIDKYKDEIKELENKIKQEEEIFSQNKLKEKTNLEKINKLNEKINNFEFVDLELIKKELETINDYNDNVKQKTRYIEAREQYVNNKSKYEELTEEIRKNENKKKDLLRESNLDLGTEIDLRDGTIYFKKDEEFVSFRDLSTSNKIKVCMKIGALTSPKLKTARIQRAESLDENSLQEIRDFAVENEYQVFAELMTSDDTIGIVIENGMIKKINS